MTADLPFRLSIAPELVFFRPEIEYACNFISQAHFLVHNDNASRILHYGPNPPTGALHIHSFLEPYLIIKDNSGIHLDRGKFEN